VTIEESREAGRESESEPTFEVVECIWEARDEEEFIEEEGEGEGEEVRVAFAIVVCSGSVVLWEMSVEEFVLLARVLDEDELRTEEGSFAGDCEVIVCDKGVGDRVVERLDELEELEGC
jgi:hypothetical protein